MNARTQAHKHTHTPSVGAQGKGVDLGVKRSMVGFTAKSHRNLKRQYSGFLAKTPNNKGTVLGLIGQAP